jgi:hypothetical protein
MYKGMIPYIVYFLIAFSVLLLVGKFAMSRSVITLFADRVLLDSHETAHLRTWIGLRKI